MLATWMAGGGAKGGLSDGSIDDYGDEVVELRTFVLDWHATILHMLGIVQVRLTDRYAGNESSV